MTRRNEVQWSWHHNWVQIITLHGEKSLANLLLSFSLLFLLHPHLLNFLLCHPQLISSQTSSSSSLQKREIGNKRIKFIKLKAYNLNKFLWCERSINKSFLHYPFQNAYISHNFIHFSFSSNPISLQTFGKYLLMTHSYCFLVS